MLCHINQPLHSRNSRRGSHPGGRSQWRICRPAAAKPLRGRVRRAGRQKAEAGPEGGRKEEGRGVAGRGQGGSYGQAGGRYQEDCQLFRKEVAFYSAIFAYELARQIW